jgi:hypothetical protein
MSFSNDIRPLFREQDRDEMEWAFDLWSYDDVKANAEAIFARLQEGDMPCDAPWPAENVAAFRAWIDAGMPA